MREPRQRLGSSSATPGGGRPAPSRSAGTSAAPASTTPGHLSELPRRLHSSLLPGDALPPRPPPAAPILPPRTPQVRLSAATAFNPIVVRPALSATATREEGPTTRAVVPAAAGFCDAHVAARRRAPVAKLPPGHVAPARSSTSVVLVELPPRRRPWGRRSSATILPAAGWTAQTAPGAARSPWGHGSPPAASSPPPFRTSAHATSARTTASSGSSAAGSASSRPADGSGAGRARPDAAPLRRPPGARAGDPAPGGPDRGGHGGPPAGLRPAAHHPMPGPSRQATGASRRQLPDHGRRGQEVLDSPQGAAGGDGHERVRRGDVGPPGRDRAQPAGAVAEVDALLAPVVAVAQQLEALPAQRVEGVRDANPSRSVGTRGS